MVGKHVGNPNGIKEIAIFIISGIDTQCCVCDTDKPPYGCARIKSFTYSNCDMEIIYNKWVVESYELAARSKVVGYEKHNRLVSGTGVMVLSKKLGSYTFFGRNANEIIAACEHARPPFPEQFTQRVR